MKTTQKLTPSTQLNPTTYGDIFNNFLSGFTILFCLGALGFGISQDPHLALITFGIFSGLALIFSLLIVLCVNLRTLYYTPIKNQKSAMKLFGK